MSGALRGIVAVDDQHAAMEGGGALDEVAGGGGIVGEQRQSEAAHTAIGERDCVSEVAIGHDGRNRAERLDIVDRVGGPGIVGAQQDRLHVGAAIGADLGLEIARHDARAGGGELGDLGADVVALAGRDQGAHVGGDLRQLLGDFHFERIEILGGGHGSADGSAFLARLDRHLGDDFGHEQVELRRAGRGVGAEQRGVETVLLGDEFDAFAEHDRVGLELRRGRGRAGEADHILPAQMVEQVADPADDQLDRAVGQQAGVDHDAEGGFAEVGGAAGRFDDRGHAGEQGRGELFEHSPDREVEGIDVDRRALERGIDVLADEAAAFAQRLQFAVEQDVSIRQFATALGGEGEQGAGAALDVDPAVLAGGAGRHVERVKLFLAGEDGEAEAFDDPRALMEGEGTQRRTADIAGVGEHGGEIDPARSGRGDETAVDGAGDVGALAGAEGPLIAAVIEQMASFHDRLLPRRPVHRNADSLG